MTKEEFIKQNIVDLLFCLYHGAGSLYFGDMDPVDFVVMESEDGKKLAGPGDWHYEIAKIIDEMNREKLISVVKSIAQQL